MKANTVLDQYRNALLEDLNEELEELEEEDAETNEDSDQTEILADLIKFLEKAKTLAELVDFLIRNELEEPEDILDELIHFVDKVAQTNLPNPSP